MQRSWSGLTVGTHQESERAHTQLVMKHSSVVVSTHWATLDWLIVKKNGTDAHEQIFNYQKTGKKRLGMFSRIPPILQAYEGKDTTTTTTAIVCPCVCFCLYDPFNCISFHKFSRQLFIFSLCSSGLISALLVLSTVYLFMKLSFSPDIIPSGWLGSKHQLTN